MFASQSPTEFYVLHSPGRILVWADTIWSYGRISISAQLQIDSLSHLGASTHILFLCCIPLLCDESSVTRKYLIGLVWFLCLMAYQHL